MIDLDGFEGEIYVVLYKGFGGNSRIDLRINFVRKLD